MALAISLSDVGIEPSEPEEPTDRAETDEEALLALALSQSQELQEQKLQVIGCCFREGKKLSQMQS